MVGRVRIESDTDTADADGRSLLTIIADRSVLAANRP